MDVSRSQTSIAQNKGLPIPAWLGGHRALLSAAVAVAVPAVWLGWPWLLAAGLAPLLLSLAPCLIMCALGLCVMKSCSKQDAPGSASAVPDSAAGHQNAPLLQPAPLTSSAQAARTPVAPAG
ncbi:MAG: hypothetical protein AB7O13_03090 [Alphaproteobacteria bacterium]